MIRIERKGEGKNYQAMERRTSKRQSINQSIPRHVTGREATRYLVLFRFLPKENDKSHPERLVTDGTPPCSVTHTITSLSASGSQQTLVGHLVFQNQDTVQVSKCLFLGFPICLGPRRFLFPKDNFPRGNPRLIGVILHQQGLQLVSRIGLDWCAVWTVARPFPPDPNPLPITSGNIPQQCMYST